MVLYKQEAEAEQLMRGKYCSDTEAGSTCASLSAWSECAYGLCTGLLQLRAADFRLSYIRLVKIVNIYIKNKTERQGLLEYLFCLCNSRNYNLISTQMCVQSAHLAVPSVCIIWIETAGQHSLCSVMI